MQLQNFLEDVLHMLLVKRLQYMNIFSSPNFLKSCDQKMITGTLKPKGEPEKLNVRMWLLYTSAVILCIVRECIFTKMTLKLLNSSTAILKRSGPR